MGVQRGSETRLVAAFLSSGSFHPPESPSRERARYRPCGIREPSTTNSTVVRLDLDSRRTYRVILMQNGKPSDNEGLRNPENNNTRVVSWKGPGFSRNET